MHRPETATTGWAMTVCDRSMAGAETRLRGLPELLRDYEIARVLSSPAVRCVQTVEPVSRSRGLDIEVREELSEEQQGEAGAALVRSLGGEQTALCVHGGLSDTISGVSQKKGEVLVLDDEGKLVERFRS